VRILRPCSVVFDTATTVRMIDVTTIYLSATE